MITVCAECHEVDRRVIGCDKKNLEEHGGQIKKGKCMICGKEVDITLCYQYGHYIMTKVA